MRPEDSFLGRLSERDRRDSEITPGTLDYSFALFECLESDLTLRILAGNHISS